MRDDDFIRKQIAEIILPPLKPRQEKENGAQKGDKKPKQENPDGGKKRD